LQTALIVALPNLAHMAFLALVALVDVKDLLTEPAHLLIWVLLTV